MEDRSNVIIAYRSIIEFYRKELHAGEGHGIGAEQVVRHNRHGGQRTGAGRKKLYATEAERKHEYRKRKRALVCPRSQVCKP